MIIVLQGKPGSGKSTAANYLIRERGFSLHKIATPMKNMLRSLGLTEEHIEGKLKREPCLMLGGQTPVHAMRTLGGEWRDMIHPDLWLFRWAETVPLGRVVVDDNRYPQEVDFLRKYANRRGVPLTFVRVVRPSGEGDDNSSHMAENQELPFDISVANMADIASFEETIGWVVDQIEERPPCP